MDAQQKEKADALAALIGQGMAITYACAVVGVSPQTYYNWQERFPDFRQQVEKANAFAQYTLLEIVNKAAKAGSVEDAKWLLVHRWPEHFARNRIEVTGPNGAPLSGGVVILPPKDPDSIAVNPVPQALPDASPADWDAAFGSDEPNEGDEPAS